MANRIHHINTLTMCPPGGPLVNGTGSVFSAGRIICHCLLIEANSGLVLVDTGIGSADVADPVGRLGWEFARITRPQLDQKHTAIAQVASLGFKTSDVRHIVLTHLDVDHAGGLPDFPDAQVHVFHTEHHAAHAPLWDDRFRYKQVQWAHNPKWVIHESEGENWFGFRSVKAVDDDVLLIPLEGHSRGHCGVAVRTQDGWLLHAGDAYFHHSELTETPNCPFALNAFQRLIASDYGQRTKNLARVKELARTQHDVVVHCAHCPTEYDRLAIART